MLTPERILSLLRVLGVALLIGCHALLFYCAPALAFVWPPAVDHLRFALPCAQLSLACCWLALGPWDWWVRVPVVLTYLCVVSGLWVELVEHFQAQRAPPTVRTPFQEALVWYVAMPERLQAGEVPAPAPQFGVLNQRALPPSGLHRLDQLSPLAQQWVLNLSAVVQLAVGLALLRLGGFRVHVMPAFDHTKERLHLSLAFLLGLVTISAIGVPLVLRLREWVGGKTFVPDWLAVASVGSMLAAITLVSLWALLKRGAAWPRLLVLAAVGPALGILPSLLSGHDADWRPFVIWAAFHTALVAVTLGGIRACEYVILRQPWFPGRAKIKATAASLLEYCRNKRRVAEMTAADTAVDEAIAEASKPTAEAQPPS